MGDIFPLVSFTLGGHFNQLAALVGQFDGRSIQVQHNQNLLITCKASQIFDLGSHPWGGGRNGVEHLFQFLHRRISNLPSGGIRHTGPDGLFQCGQIP